MGRCSRFGAIAALFLTVAPCPKAQNFSQQQLVVPYWTTEPGWNTQIEVRNNRRDKAVSVHAVLRLSDGTSVSLPAISVDPAESKPIDLGLSVAAIASGNTKALPAYGSALLQFEGNSPANVFAAAIVRRVGYPIAFHFDALPSEMSAFPGSRETLWLLPSSGATTYVVATNTSGKSSSARFTISDTTNRAVVVERSLAAGQSARVSVREILPDLPANAMGSISVSMSDSSPDFTVIAFAYDDSSGFSAVSKVFERDPTEEVGTITLRAPMVALSQPATALSFAEGTALQPRILLKNASPAALAPRITVRWRAPGALGVSSIASITMKPGDLRVISLADEAKPGIPSNADWAGVSIEYSGRHGDIVPITASYDLTGRYGTQTPFSPTVAAKWEGGMWHAGGSLTNTVMTVGNGGTDATTALLTLHFNGGKSAYEIQRQLAPGEQAWVDIGEIIRTQAADAKGNFIPPDVMNGTYSIRDVKHNNVGYLFEGKINVDRTFGHAMYGCAICCGDYPPFTVPSSTTMAVGGLSFQQEIHATNSCWGFDDDLTSDGYSWSSSASSIVGVSNVGLVSGLAAGSATVSSYIDYTASFAFCPPRTGHPGGPVNVKPVITEPNTVWWFNGAIPGGYNTQIVLVANGTASASWNVSAGAGKVSLSPAGNQVTVTSTGSSFSSSVGDISITATANGQTSAPFSLTTRTPSKLVPAGFGVACDPTFGYDAQITYSIQDQLTTLLPNDVAVNEDWTTSIVPDYSGTNWIRGPVQGGVTLNLLFFDNIQGQDVTGSTTPVPFPYCGGATGSAVEHWGQEWRVGSSAAGFGKRVRTDTLQKYQNSAAHTGIVSPAP